MTKKRCKILLTAACTACVGALALGMTSHATLLSDNTVEAKAQNESAITSASLTLGSCISVRYYVDYTATNGLTMSFTMNGEKTDASPATDANGTYFDYAVAPQCMGDEITATLYDGGSEIETKAYSVETYCKSAIASDSSSAALKTLCADILAYGAAAQTYTGHNANDLVNAENAGTPTTFAAPESVKAIEGTIDGETAFTGATLYYDNTNSIYLIFKTDDLASLSYSVTCDGETTEDYKVVEYGEGTYAIVTGDIYALDLDSVYTATITKGEASQTVTYSVGSYVNSMQDNANAGALVKALWNYGVSSQVYYDSRYMGINLATEEYSIGFVGENGWSVPIPEQDGNCAVGAISATKVYDEKITITTAAGEGNLVGAMQFTLRGGATADLESINANTTFITNRHNRTGLGLYVQIERTGGEAYAYIGCNGTDIARSEDGIDESALNAGFTLSMQAKDVVVDGVVKGVTVTVWLGNEVWLEATADAATYLDVTKPAWFLASAWINPDWHKLFYIDSVVLTK